MGRWYGWSVNIPDELHAHIRLRGTLARRVLIRSAQPVERMSVYRLFDPPGSVLFCGAPYVDQA